MKRNPQPQKPYSNLMYQYMGVLLFVDMYEHDPGQSKDEWDKIKQVANDLASQLSEEEVRMVRSRAKRLQDDYYDYIYYEVENEFEHDYGFDDYSYRDRIEYDSAVYEIWKEAVRKRKTVKMTYDSNTSGITERAVDPYRSDAPYGEGFCHLRQEVRQFRFDRVIDLKMTDQTFTK
jgi:hypothetical protein